MESKSLSVGVVALALFAVSTLGAAAQDDDAIRLGQSPGPLAPGTYSDDSLGPLVRFSVGDGWEMSGEPLVDIGFELASTDDFGAIMTITQFDGTVLAEPTDANGCPSFPDQTVSGEASVDAFVENLAGNPLLTTDDPVEVEIAGYRGLQADVTATVPAGCDLGAVFLWSLPETSMRMSGGGQARFIALDVDGEVVVMFIESFTPEADYPAFLDKAMAVVETLAITPSSTAADES